MARKFTVEGRITGDSRQLRRETAQAEGRLRRFGNFIRSRLVLTFGELAQAARVAFQAIEDAANLEGVEANVRRQLDAVGVDFDEFLAKLDEVAQGTVSRNRLIRESSEALLLGIPAREIADLLEIARASAVATGRDVAQAFSDIATGIGRASPEILDNLGITVRLGEVQAKLAERLNVSTQELTQQQKSQALLNEVLRVGRQRVEELEGAQGELSRRIQQGTAAFDDFKTRGSQALGALALGFGSLVVRIADFSSLAVEGITKVTKALSTLAEFLPFIGDRFEGATDALEGFDERVDAFQERARTMGQRLTEASSAMLRLSLGLETGEEASEGAARGLRRAADSAARVREATEGAREETTGLGDAFEDTGADAEALGGALTTTSTGARALGREAERARTSVRRLREEARQARFDFEALAAAQGRAAAVSEALRQGGRLTQGGTRVRLPGGGSRLVDAPGFGSGGGTESRFFEGVTTLI